MIEKITKITKELERRERITRSKMIAERVTSNGIYFRHYLFETYKIFVFINRPTVSDLKKIKLSNIQINSYINNKNYKEHVSGRCKLFEETKTIIISVNNFKLFCPDSLGTLTHELSHCTHRLFESKKHNFSEEGFSTLLGDLVEITLKVIQGKCEPLKDSDLLWNSIMVFSSNDKVFKGLFANVSNPTKKQLEILKKYILKEDFEYLENEVNVGNNQIYYTGRKWEFASEIESNEGFYEVSIEYIKHLLNIKND